MLMFLNLKGNLVEGNIISISNTNLVYIEPHELRIKDITYLFFNDCCCYIREDMLEDKLMG